MKALVEPGDSTRFDVPVFDETRLDNLRALTPARGLRTSGAIMLAPPPARPRSWAEDTSFDHFDDLDLTDEPVPAAFTRTLERPDEGHSTGRSRTTTPPPGARSASAAAAAATGGSGWRSAPSRSSPPARSAAC